MASVETAAAPGSASRDRQPISASTTAPTTPGSAARGARRNLAKDLRAGDSNLEACSPRMLNRKLLLLQQQASEEGHHQHLLQKKQQQQQQLQAMNMAAAVLNSRRVYPSSSRQQFVDSSRVRGSSWDLSSECSNHGSPVVAARRVPKKMVVDEKQLALRLMRARNSAQALTSSSSSSSSSASSSSSSENPSLRASVEDSSRRAASYAAELVRRGLLGGSLSRQHQHQHQGSASSSGGSLGSPESTRAPGRSRGSAVAVEEKQALMPCAATGSSGRSSDAEESSRPRSASEEEKSALVSSAATLLRSASASSASSSKLRLKAADMAAAMQEHAFQCAQEVLDGMDKLQCKRVAWALKKEFDKTYGPAWHCIVGTSFGSYVTHSVGGFLYFSIGKVSVLLFQTAVELIEHH